MNYCPLTYILFTNVSSSQDMVTWDTWFSDKLQNIDEHMLRVDKLKEKMKQDLGYEMAARREYRCRYLKPTDSIRAMCFFGLSRDRDAFGKVGKYTMNHRRKF